jgi:hypothetical protein
MEPELAPTSSYSSRREDGPRSTGGGGPPTGPSFASRFRLAEAIDTARSRRTVAVVLTIYQLLLVALPRLRVFAEMPGTKYEAVKDYQPVLTLGMTVILAHLCGLLADAARTARSLDVELDVGFDTGDKFSMSVVLGDGVDEGTLFGSKKEASRWRRQVYWVARVVDRMAAYGLLLAVIVAGFWLTIGTTLPALRSGSGVDRLVPMCALVLLVLATARLAQYWIIRFDGMARYAASGAMRTADRLTPPRKFSLTSISFWTLAYLRVFVVEIAGIVYGWLRKLLDATWPPEKRQPVWRWGAPKLRVVLRHWRPSILRFRRVSWTIARADERAPTRGLRFLDLVFAEDVRRQRADLDAGFEAEADKERDKVRFDRMTPCQRQAHFEETVKRLVSADSGKTAAPSGSGKPD